MKAFVCILTLAVALCAQTLVTTVTLQELDGNASSSFPVTFGHPFAKGDVPQFVAAKINGNPVTTQCDVKNRWEDGSVRFAIISFLVPAITAKGSVAVDLVTSSTTASTGAMDKVALLATDFDARLTFDYRDSAMTRIDSTKSLSARQIINAVSALPVWLAGSVCTEFLLNDTSLNPCRSQNIQWQVRVFPGWNGIRVSTVVENCWHNTMGNIYYDFDLELGHASPARVYGEDSLRHWHDARWRKVFWLGTPVPDINVKYDINYWIAAGTIPAYDVSLGVDSAVTVSNYAAIKKPVPQVVNTYGATTNALMSSSLIAGTMGTAGGRPDIGLLPGWTVAWLLSQDRRDREVALFLGEKAGSYPTHLRDRNTGRLATIDDHPNRNPWNWASDPYWFPSPCTRGDMTCPRTAESAHTPSLTIIPYMITGDYFYQEEAQYWGAFSMWLSHFASSREYDKGLIKGWQRATAWSLRDVAEAWYCAPDSSPEHAYFREKADNNMLYASGRIDTMSADPGNIFNIYLHSSSDINFNANDLPYTTIPYDSLYSGFSPWMNNYLIITLDQMVHWGFPDAVKWRNFSLGLQLGLATHHPDYLKWDIAPYRLITARKDTSTRGYRYAADWAEFWQWNYATRPDSLTPTGYTMAQPGHDYQTIYHYVLTLAKRASLPGADTAYNSLHTWLTTSGNNQYAGMEVLRHTTEPQWYITLADPWAEHQVATETGKDETADNAGITASPNPFNPSVNISINGGRVLKEAVLKLAIFNINGVKVADLSERIKNSSVIWNAAKCGSGIYFIRLQTGNKILSRKIILSK